MVELQSTEELQRAFGVFQVFERMAEVDKIKAAQPVIALGIGDIALNADDAIRNPGQPEIACSL